MAGPFFIDFEAFQHGSERPMVKELCIMEFHRPLTPLYYMFRPDCQWNMLDEGQQKTYTWETNHHHHIDWDEGNTRFCSMCIMSCIKEVFPAWNIGMFYVMECESNGPKVKILKKMFPKLNIVNYNVTFDALPTITPNIVCLYRNHSIHCAYLKCMRMLQHHADSVY